MAGEESEKPDIADFKRAVWHKCFEVLLKTISLLSITGIPVLCGGTTWHQVYPFIFVLAADYEEQYVM